VIPLACTIDTRPIYEPDVVTIKPRTVCEGDCVEVCWDLQLPREQRFCDCPYQGYDEWIPCVSSSDCSPSGVCLDEYCNNNACIGTRSVDGCPPANHSITLFSSPTPLDPPVIESTEETGCREICPDKDTTVTLEEAWYHHPGTNPLVYQPETHSIDVIEFDEELIVDFQFVCPPPGWNPVTHRDQSEHVSVTSVTNVSGYDINLTSNEVQQFLMDGQSTDRFNGKLTGTWTAELTQDEKNLLPYPTCGVVVSDPWPDLQVSVTLECTIE
jgi:hypothetical protein